MFALGLALPLIFIPRWTGGGIATGWELLSCVLPFALWRIDIKVNTAHGCLLATFGFAVISLAWTPLPQGIFGLWILSILVVAFFVGSGLSDLRPLYTGLALGIGINGLIAVAQWLGWTGIYQAAPPAGLFINKNVLAEATALVAIAAAAERLWWAVPLMLPGLVLTHSRGALAGLAAAAAVWLWSRSRIAALGIALAAAGATVLIMRGDVPYSSLQNREMIWADTLDALTWRGHGIGSFEALYPAYATRKDTLQERPNHAHSEPLEWAFELGVGALPLAVVLFLALGGAAETERLLLVGFLVIGLFSFPAHVPVTGFLAFLAAGHLVRRRTVDGAVGVRGRSVLPARLGAGRPVAAAAWSVAIPVRPQPTHGAGLLRVDAPAAVPDHDKPDRWCAGF